MCLIHKTHVCLTDLLLSRTIKDVELVPCLITPPSDCESRCSVGRFPSQVTQRQKYNVIFASNKRKHVKNFLDKIRVNETVNALLLVLLQTLYVGSPGKVILWIVKELMAVVSKISFEVLSRIILEKLIINHFYQISLPQTNLSPLSNSFHSNLTAKLDWLTSLPPGPK